MVFRLDSSLKQFICRVVDLLKLRDCIKVLIHHAVGIFQGDGSNDIDIQFLSHLADSAVGNHKMFSAFGRGSTLSKHLR